MWQEHPCSRVYNVVGASLLPDIKVAGASLLSCIGFVGKDADTTLKTVSSDVDIKLNNKQQGYLSLYYFAFDL